jgi:hypothetical protein
MIVRSWLLQFVVAARALYSADAARAARRRDDAWLADATAGSQRPLAGSHSRTLPSWLADAR